MSVLETDIDKVYVFGHSAHALWLLVSNSSLQFRAKSHSSALRTDEYDIAVLDSELKYSCCFSVLFKDQCNNLFYVRGLHLFCMLLMLNCINVLLMSHVYVCLTPQEFSPSERTDDHMLTRLSHASPSEAGMQKCTVTLLMAGIMLTKFNV